jgi:hypothetical protein
MDVENNIHYDNNVLVKELYDHFQDFNFKAQSTSLLYSSPSIVGVIKARRMRWAGHVARMGEVRGACNILVGRPEGRRPLGRPKRRWEDNIKMDLRE